MKLEVKVVASVSLAIDYIKKNYYLSSMKPNSLIENINSKGISKMPDGSLLIVDELGILN